MLFRLSDRWFYGAVALAAVLIVGLALLWPQGIGKRAPGPFGGPVVIPEYVKLDEKKAARRREAVRDIRRAQDDASGGIQVEEPK